MTTSKNAVASHDDDRILALTREDLVASVSAYRKGSRSSLMWLPGAGVFGGLALGASLIFIGEALHWPEVLGAAFFFSGWAISIGCLIVVFRRNRRLVESCQWKCAHCEAPMIATRGVNPAARAEVAIASGRCPVCGEELFDT